MSNNNHGKLLEYVTYLMIKQIQARMSKDLKSDTVNLKFEQEWKLLKEAQRADFRKFAIILSKYFVDRIKPESQIIMPNDRTGIAGNVADIIIDQTNISIKNNRTYAKSQRPIAFAAQLGLDPFDTVIYNMAYGEIAYQPWIDYGGVSCLQIEYKSELYDAIYSLLRTYLDRANPDQIARLFKFLSGEPHYQAINMNDHVIIYDMTKKPIPTGLKTRLDSKNGHLVIEFNNNWIYKLRAHTASKKITRSLSLKFDTILVNQNEIISSVKLSKLHNPRYPQV